MQGIGGTYEELLNYYFLTQKLPLPVSGKMASHFTGSYQSHFRGRGIDFAEVRNYQAGDDIRLMDWRVTARTGKAHTKVFHEEKERPIFLLVDQSESMQFGSKVTFKSILAARAASWLAWISLHQGDRVGGIIFDDKKLSKFPPKARRQSLLPLITTLATSCQPHIITSSPRLLLKMALQHIQYMAKPGALIIVISDFYQLDDDCLTLLSQLSQQSDVRGLYIYDPLEQQAPKANIYHISDGEQIGIWNTQNQQAREQYENKFKNRQAWIKQQLQHNQIPMLSLATDDDWQMILTYATRHWSNVEISE